VIQLIIGSIFQEEGWTGRLGVAGYRDFIIFLNGGNDCHEVRKRVEYIQGEKESQVTHL